MDGAPASLTHPLLQRLYAYWGEKRAEGRRPGRADIDPVELAFILGSLLLVEVITGTPPRFRIRIHGTNLARLAGYDLTGKMLDELPINDFRELAQRSFATVAATGEPFHASRDRVIDGRRRRYETLMLPLFDAAGGVNMLLIGLIYL